MNAMRLICSFAAGFAFAVTTAWAQQPEQRGWYAGLATGQMEAKGDCPSGASCDQKDSAGKVYGGYRIHRHFAAEAFYADWGKIKVTGGALTATGELKSYGIAGLGIVPVGPGFELFGKLGLAHSTQQPTAIGGGVTLPERNTGADGLIGLGAAYNFTPNLGVRAEWERMIHSEVDALTIGLQVRF